MEALNKDVEYVLSFTRPPELSRVVLVEGVWEAWTWTPEGLEYFALDQKAVSAALNTGEVKMFTDALGQTRLKPHPPA